MNRSNPEQPLTAPDSAVTHLSDALTERDTQQDGPTRCPPEQQLRDWLADKTAGTATALEAHVEKCPTCQRLLDCLLKEQAGVVVFAPQSQVASDSLGVTRDSPVPLVLTPPRNFEIREGGVARLSLNIDGCEIRSELGRGGMGIVYKAWQRHLNRFVAVKTLRAGPGISVEHLIRFRQEAEVIARLQHPNIVHLFGMGESGETPYLIMEFIGGGTLSQRAGGNPLSAVEAARVVSIIARAVAYAHEQGIIHRDLKPSNVLVTVEGILKVADFGLAKSFAVDSGLTATDAVVGTPAYMSPEQATGEKELTVGVDVYGLGAILYELLTGRPPFIGQNAIAVVDQLRTEEPTSPSQLCPGVPRDLETICLKCLEKDPARRYPSANALGDDLARFQEGRPVTARPLSTAERAWRWCRRNRAVAALLVTIGALAILIATGSTVTAFILNNERDRAVRAEGAAHAMAETEKELREAAEREQKRAEAEKQRAEDEKKRADTRAEDLRRALAASSGLLADSAWKVHTTALARARLDEVPGDLRGVEWACRQRLFEGSLYTLHGGRNVPINIVLSPDGRVVAGARWNHIEGRDLVTGVEVFAIELPPQVGAFTEIAFSPDGRLVAGGISDGTARVWDVRTRKQVAVMQGHAVAVQAVAFSPDGRRLATASRDKTARVWDVETGKQLAAFEGHPNAVFAVAFSPDGERVASGGQMGHAQHDVSALAVWDSRTGKTIGTPLKNPFGDVTAIAFSPDGRRLAVSLSGVPVYTSFVRVWDVATGAEQFSLDHGSSLITRIAFRPDGQRLATSSRDNLIRVWDPRSGKKLATLQGHSGSTSVQGLTYTPAGRHLVSSGGDATTRVWNPETGGDQPRAWENRAWGGRVYAVSFAPDGRMTTTEGDILRVREPDTGRELLAIRAPGRVFSTTAFSPDGRRLAGSWMKEDHTVCVWDAQTGGQVMVLKGHEGVVGSIAFSRDGRLIATGSADKTARVWDAQTGKELRVFRLAELGKAGGVERDLRLAGLEAVAFAPDGRLATVCANGAAVVWDTQSEKPLLELQTSRESIRGVVFSPDGNRLVTTHGDGTVRLWDSRTGAPRGTLAGHTAAATGSSFTPDGSRLATGSNDGTVRVWDPATGRELLTLWLPSTGDVIHTVAFSPDGRRLAAGSSDQRIRVWDISPVRSEVSVQWRERAVTGLAFSPDGTRFAAIRAGSEMTTVWDARTGQELTGQADFPVPLDPRSRDGKFWLSHDGISIRVVSLDVSPGERFHRNTLLQPDVAWHRSELEDAEKAGDTFAIRFHLAQLVQLRPFDPATRERYVAVLRRSGNRFSELAVWVEALPSLLGTPAWPVTEDYRRAAIAAQRASDWTEASRLWGKVVTAEPERLANGLALTECQLAAGQFDAYAASCRSLVVRFAGTIDPQAQIDLVRRVTAVPGVLEQPTQAVIWAENALSSEATPERLRAVGAALVRAGRAKEALRRFEEAVKVQGSATRDDMLWLALGHHLLDQPERAKQFLAEALKTEPENGIPSFEVTRWRLLRREVETALNGPKK